MIRALRNRIVARRGAAADEGVTLTELLVAASLSLLVLTMVAAMFIQTAQMTASATQNRNSTTVASTAAADIANVIRLATTIQVKNSVVPLPAIVSGTGSTLSVYSLVDTTSANPAPSLVTFDGTGAELKETRCPGTLAGGFWTFSGCTTSTRNLGGSIIAPASGESPLFSYRAGDSTPIALVSGSLPAASLPNVASIVVSIKIQAVGSHTGPAYLTSAVGMPNVGLDQGGS
jgi:hypothetical protein